MSVGGEDEGDDDDDDDDDDGELSSVNYESTSNPKKSLEALFQVTRNELKRIKCPNEVVEQSSDDGLHCCPLCGVGCAKASVLQKHMRTHTGERPYSCLPCGIAFKTKVSLYKHCKSIAHHQSEAVHGGVNDEAVIFRRRKENGTDVDTDDSFGSDVSETHSSDTGKTRIAPNPMADVRASSGSTSIYKPKFHLTVHNQPTSSSATEVRPPTPPADHSTAFSMPSSCRIPSRTTSSHVELDTNTAAKTDDAFHDRVSKRSLAKRRDEAFRLRLEIPPSSALLRRSDDSEEMESADGIQGAKPQPSSSRGVVDVTESNSSSVKSLRSPMGSPEFLQRHISKLISQNAAIVDTLNPMWPRRYTRQSGGFVTSRQHQQHHQESNSPPNGKRFRRYDEIAPQFSASAVPSSDADCNNGVPVSTTSHLARALLSSEDPFCPAPKKTHFAKDFPPSSVVPSVLHRTSGEPIDSSFTYLVDSEAERYCSALHSPSSENDDVNDDCVDDDKSCEKNPAPTNAQINSQNPEGSIIKDLLLKARTVQSSSSCVRLSGGSISVVPLEQLRYGELDASEDASSEHQHVCHLCQHANFRSAENLEVHQTHYCRHRVPASSDVVEDPPSMSDRSRANQSLSLNKPRGRPKGSKNRPKTDVQMTTVSGRGRVHSRSLCEDATSGLLDVQFSAVADERSSYRRNSVSGEPSAASIKDILRSHHSHESKDLDGSILKKHLLLVGGDRSPPIKKRKIPETLFSSAESVKSSATSSSMKSLEDLSRQPLMRTSATSGVGLLFEGSSVQAYDGFRSEIVSTDSLTKQLEFFKEDGKSTKSQGGEKSKARSGIPSSVLATIAKPVHNSGGTVLQAKKQSQRKWTSMTLANVSRPLMATGRSDLLYGRSSSSSSSSTTTTTTTYGNLSGATVLSPPSSSTHSQSFSIDISHLNLRTSLADFSPSGVSSDYSVLSQETLRKMERIRRSEEVPSIAVHSPKSPPRQSALEDDESMVGEATSHQRPTSLLLNSGSIRHSSMVGTTLVSPETPRPEKKYGQCYLNGQYYTYLELKHSTRVYYCCIGRPQPMYVPQSTDPKLSMYSVWQTVPQEPDAIGPVQALGLYNSRPHYKYTVAAPSETPLQTTHSSYWTYRLQNEASSSSPEDESVERLSPVRGAVENDDRENLETDESDCVNRPHLRAHDMDDDVRLEEDDEAAVTSGVVIDRPSLTDSNRPSSVDRQIDSSCVVDSDGHRRVRIFEGGFKSNESYTYVRGRGRGKYVCEDCGIRCKKPSMLKKHVRTHTDLRPYACNHCSFSFKTKGNLTKHMKSKAHHKKCIEMGIVPVPVSIDDVQIDEEALARQERIEHQRRQFANDDDDSDMDEDDEDDDDEEEDEDYEENESLMTRMQSYEEEDDESVEEGQFADADGLSERPPRMGTEFFTEKASPSEQEVVARSLLDLGRADVVHNIPDQSRRPYGSAADDDDDDECGDEPSSVDQPIDLSMPHSRIFEDQLEPTEADLEDEDAYGLGDVRDVYDGGYASSSRCKKDDERNPDFEGQHQKDRLQFHTGTASFDSVDETVAPYSAGLLQSYLLSDKDVERTGVVRDRFEKLTSRYNDDEDKQRPSSPLPPSSYERPRPNPEMDPAATSISSASDHHRSAAKVLSPMQTASAAGGRNAPPSTYAQRPMDPGEGKCVCNICNKMFTRPSQLRLHVNIHYFERPFRCDSCAISFRTKGHLQKHKRSISHYNKVNMNLAFGTPTTDNPRPFKCGDCKIAFRIHGHLAKHLRSKMHIMKLECLGKLPFGTYAEIERSGASLNEIDTSDCDNSLESLQTMAMRLVDKETISYATTATPAAATGTAPGSGSNGRQFWSRERTISGGSIGDDQSDGVPYVESPGEVNVAVVVPTAHPHPHPPPPPTQHHHHHHHHHHNNQQEQQQPPPPPPPHGHTVKSSRLYVIGAGGRGGGGRDSPDSDIGGLVTWSSSQKTPLEAGNNKSVISDASSASVKHETVERTIMSSPRRSASVKVVVMVERDLHGDDDESPCDYVDTRNYYSSGSSSGGGSGGVGVVHDAYAIEDISADEEDELEAAAAATAKGNATAAGRHLCQSPRMTMSSRPVSISTWEDSQAAGAFVHRDCTICGETCSNAHALKQHLVVHSRLRPFVCEWCDAGFTTALLLKSHHLQVHDREYEDNKELAGSAELKCHLLECGHRSSPPSKLFSGVTMAAAATDKGRDSNTDRYDPT